jgi:hypothetical protein
MLAPAGFALRAVASCGGQSAQSILSAHLLRIGWRARRRLEERQVGQFFVARP